MADEVILTDEEKRAKALEHLTGKKAEVPGAKTQDEIDAQAKLAEEQRLEAKKKEEEAEALRLEEEKKKQQPAPVVKAELTDDELVAELEKRTGRKVKSLDDLKPTPTEDDKKKAEENRDADKLSYGLKKGLFNRKQYESFIADSKDPKELVYGRELAAAKADDPAWDDEKEKTFRAEFEEEFGLDLDPSSSKRKRGEKKLIAIAENILQKEYAPILNLDSAYGQYENQVNSQKEQEQKIIQAAPAYREDVTSIVSGLNKIDFAFGADSFEVPVSKEMSEDLSEVMLDNNFSASQILSGVKKDKLNEFARQYLIGKYFQDLSFEAAKKYREKHEKGVRGIPESGKLETPGDDNPELSDRQKTALSYLRGQPVVAN